MTIIFINLHNNLYKITLHNDNLFLSINAIVNVTLLMLNLVWP